MTRPEPELRPESEPRPESQSRPEPEPRKPRLNLDDVELDPSTTSDERGPDGSGSDAAEDVQRREAELRRQRPPHHGG